LFRFPREEYNRLIAQRPRWFVPLLIAIVFGAGYIYVFNVHIAWEPWKHRFFDNNPQILNLPAEQRERVFAMQLRIPAAAFLSYPNWISTGQRYWRPAVADAGTL
jgi:hypothetical protein